MTIALKKQFLDWIDKEVRSGRYNSETEVVEEALREKMEKEEKDYFQERLRLSEEDVKAGRVVRADEAFFERKRQRIRDLYMAGKGSNDDL
jgi:putative addiction module CopG family antidote